MSNLTSDGLRAEDRIVFIDLATNQEHKGQVVIANPEADVLGIYMIYQFEVRRYTYSGIKVVSKDEDNE
ncbi:hypothetical protein IWQ60_010069 [Tieghemiomyces parasiticus]|uniref:Uncharacterized protein n=1 Tax=Tieghemiomyces parasiticus TaxID=78921 RepID=A0A9W7ZKX1_9FUNG|nr:hypothetical protein IWQ60_010069 [Tieghemiomyces parasiticus]